MFKNLLLFRIVHWDAPAVAALEERLQAGRFVACAATQPLSAGWVEPRGKAHAALAERVGGHLILKLCTETKAVPAAAVRQHLQERLDAIEAQTGRRPKGRAARDLKDEIVIDLLPRAFAKRRGTLVWIDAAAQWVALDASSFKQADAVIDLLVEALGGGLALQALQTAQSPSTAMAGWLEQQEPPPGFTIDRECELKQPDSDKACVRYARHPLDIDEVVEHIRQGKRPTRLALTWQGRVSFVLGEDLALRKVELLDVALEGAGKAANDGADDGFDADVAIATGELGSLIPDLVDALGGELEQQPAGAPALAAAA